jgi:hypothetical protein
LWIPFLYGIGLLLVLIFIDVGHRFCRLLVLVPVPVLVLPIAVIDRERVADPVAAKDADRRNRRPGGCGRGYRSIGEGGG